MRKVKKLSNKLIAILLSASMVFAPILQSIPVYAAEPIIEEGSTDTLPDNAATDETVTDKNDSDTPTADNGDSGNQGTENGDTGKPGTENGGSDNSGTENGDSDNSGTENGDTGNTGNENGDSDNSGTENGDSETPGTEDGDTENLEEPDAEDGDSGELGDAEADGSLNEDILPEEDLETVGVMAATARGQSSVNVSSFSNVGGWNESIYAEIAGVKPEDVVDVEYSGTAAGKLSAQKGNADGETALDYLVRTDGSGVRIDVPGLKAGTYTLTVTLGSNKKVLKEDNITVYAYDRSGYAHFKYTNGVGAYKDDGTLKSNAIVLYVNDANKNTVKITAKDGTSVTGIGNILNSAGQKTNGNKGIIKKIAGDGRPIVVRFIGVVSDSGLNGESGEFHAENTKYINGLTAYNSTDDGGSVGDNGHMARIQSGKDITLEGIGYDATIDGWGFHFIAEGSTAAKGYGKSFEVRNLKFVNTPEDAIGMEGQQSGTTISASVERCWIHNNEFYRPNIPSPAESDKAEGDGSVDFKRGMYLTCSYNYFDSCHKTNLVGSSDTSLQYNLSYHHNYWYMCKARGPLTRQANVHMYNNIFDMQTDYAMNTRANAYIFSESNLFYACKSPHAVEAGAIKSWNDSITSVLWNKGNKGTVVSSRDEVVSSDCAYNGTSYSSFENNSNLFYKDNYQLQDDDFVTMRKVIVSQTGIQKHHPKRPEEVTASDYSVIERMSGGKTPKQIDVSNGTVTETPGKISNTVYVFEVNANFDLEVNYSSGTGVVVDEEGKNRLEGDGKALNLPAGKYMIQALTFEPGDPTNNTIVKFKNITINSLKISKSVSGAHVHNWLLESTKAATCTAAGEKTYKCTGSGTCDAGNVKKESIPALGHNYLLVAGSETATCTADGTVDYKCSRCSNIDKRPMSATGHKWGSWSVKIPATATTAGVEERVCANDSSHVETKEIPASGSGTTDPDPDPDPTPGPGNITVAGDYELNFKGKKPNGDTDFFKFGNAAYKNGKGPVTVNGVEYTDCYYIDSSSSLAFDCNDGSSLILKLDVSGKNLEIDGKTYTSDENGEIKVDLDAGTHTIAKGKTGGKDIFIFYVSVKNGALEGTYHNLSFSYNYDNSPEDKVVSLQEGTVYTEEELLALASLNRNGCTLTGLYTDPFCKNAVIYPYTVSGSVILYAGWKDDGNIGDNEVIEKTYSLIFDSNGGTTVATVMVSENQQYTIRQRPTKSGYVFAGWYDAKTGGNLVEVVDGASLKGNMTVYAHWNVLSDSFTLDCAVDLSGADIPSTPVDSSDAKKGRNIAEQVTKNGFTLHALSGESGSTKNYMTVHAADTKTDASAANPLLLYTNGVIVDDNENDPLLKTIEFTAPGAGELTVKVAASGDLKKTSNGVTTVTGTCDIVLSKMVDGKLQQVFTRSLEDKIQREITIDIESAGTYYLYAAKQKDGAELPAKGVAYSSISFTQPKYTILYQTKGGTATGIVDVNVPKAAGDKIQLPTDCILDGYTFEGWLIGDSTTAVGKDTAYTYTVSADDAIDGTITITAKYTPVQYTIKYNSAGGSMDSDSSDPVPAGKVISLPKPTPPEGKDFVGWTVGEGDSKRTLLVSYTVRAADADVNKNITLTAEYKDKPVVYTIKFDGNGGSLPSGLQDVKLLEGGKTITLGSYQPTSTGKRFMGWQVKGVELEDTVYTVKAEDADENKIITITAVFEQEYTVNFNAGEGTLPLGMASGNKYISGERVTLDECTLAESSDNKFDGWYINNPETLIKTSSYIVDPADADSATKTITLTAKYVPKVAKKYTVTLELDGGELIGGGNMTSLEYTEGSEFNETADKYGYNFTGWTLNGQEITLPYPVTGDITLKAEYEKKPVVYSIKFDGSGGRLPVGLQRDWLLAEGEEIALDEYQPTKDGYRFVGWQINDIILNGSEYIVKAEDVDGNNTITIKAAFEQEYTVNFDAGEGTLPSGMTSGDKYIEGETVTLGDCTPPSAQKFNGWIMNDIENNLVSSQYVVNAADADKNNTITFKAVYASEDDNTVYYTVTLDTDGGTLVNGGGLERRVRENDTINPGECNKNGYVFKGWTVDEVAVTLPYTVTNDVTLKAIYEGISYNIVYQTGDGSAPEGLSASAKTGEVIQLADAIPAKGYTFKGWSVDGGTTTFKDSYTVKAEDVKDGVITIIAVYEEGPSHKGIAIVGLKEEYEFTGAKIIPNIAVVDYDIEDANGIDGHKALSPGVDYTVKYANNSKLTSVSKKDSVVTVTGKGNYAGKYTEATFKIVEPKAIEAALEDLKGAKLSKINPVEYNGNAQYPEIELKLKNGTPTKYIYDKADGVYKVKEGTSQGTAIGAKVSLSNNINKGTATILLTGANGANGKATTIKKTFKITPIDISKENKLTVVAEPATYSVKGAVPSKLTVHYKDDNIDKDLINGVDYTVKYSSNKKAGVKGKIAITGKGNYAKKHTTATYDINQLVWSTEDTGKENPIKAVQAYAGLKAGKVKATVVDKDGNTLKPSQYTLKVYKNDETSECDKSYVLIAGDVIHVEATAKDTTNLKGTTARPDFKVGNNIAKAKFVLNKVNGKAFTAQYTGEKIELNPTDLTVTMKGVSGKLKASPEVLDDNEEYAYEIVSYSNNINKGTATAVIKGINGYSGTKTVKFKIVGKTMAIDEENRNIPWKDIPSQFKSFMNGIFN